MDNYGTTAAKWQIMLILGCLGAAAAGFWPVALLAGAAVIVAAVMRR